MTKERKMLVASSFDLWQRDTFFSAAEEVQASADIMESAYRTWVRQQREGVTPQVFLDELCRELQTALGTAKWQLDEFERAVRVSYRIRTDEITAARHRQFVTAIGDQISRVEGALREFFDKEGKKPLRWVNLDEKECDDLAMFLSGTPRNPKVVEDDFTEAGAKTKGSLLDKQSPRKDLGSKTKCSLSDKQSPREDLSYNSNLGNGCKDVVNGSMDASYVIELELSEVPGTSDDSSCQADRKASTRRTWSPPDTGELKIVIPCDDEQEKATMLRIEATPKEKGYKPSFWKPRGGNGNHPHAKGGISSYTYLRGNNWISQLFKGATGSQRQLQTSIRLQKSRSFQLTLALMLIIFLIVPFVMYSN